VCDEIIVGGGPPGLRAALVLSRCRHRVLVFDEGHPRNARSHGVHNFLTREGTPPDELLRLARREVGRLGVEMRSLRVTAATRRKDGFEIRAGGRRVRASKLLLATGVRDEHPSIDGLDRFVGRGVYYCSYCDGFDVCDRPLAALGHGVGGAELALALTTWSTHVAYCTNGTRRPRGAVCERLDRYGIRVRSERIVRVEGGRHLETLVMRSGERIACEGLFIQEGDHPQSDLAARLGCRFTRRGAVRTRAGGRTTVPSLYVAGDAADDVRAVVVAAANGAKAAFAINQELREERCRLPRARD
jgi:thioredoxin reductase